jgi:lysophospholipid acyltransferase (LPLAT)-like uncharacterized protein
MAEAVTRPRIVVPHRPRWFQRLGATILCGSERVLSASLRDRSQDETGLLDQAADRRAIFCVWHNRLALSMLIYRNHVRRKPAERRLAALVSASKDGAFLASILEAFGVQPVRGSSSRRGSQALLELTTWAERGYDIAITPDGPRGPCYKVQDGIVVLAQLTGLPIIPVNAFVHPRLNLRSWDRFQIPLPFARCEIHLGKPLRVPREISDAERETLRLELAERMRAATRD